MSDKFFVSEKPLAVFRAQVRSYGHFYLLCTIAFVGFVLIYGFATGARPLHIALMILLFLCFAFLMTLSIRSNTIALFQSGIQYRDPEVPQSYLMWTDISAVDRVDRCGAQWVIVTSVAKHRKITMPYDIEGKSAMIASIGDIVGTSNDVYQQFKRVYQ